MKKSIPLSKIISASVSYCSNLELSCHYIKGKGIDVNKVKVHLLLERVRQEQIILCGVVNSNSECYIPQVSYHQGIKETHLRKNKQNHLLCRLSSAFQPKIPFVHGNLWCVLTLIPAKHVRYIEAGQQGPNRIINRRQRTWEYIFPRQLYHISQKSEGFSNEFPYLTTLGKCVPNNNSILHKLHVK